MFFYTEETWIDPDYQQVKWLICSSDMKTRACFSGLLHSGFCCRGQGSRLGGFRESWRSQTVSFHCFIYVSMSSHELCFLNNTVLLMHCSVFGCSVSYRPWIWAKPWHNLKSNFSKLPGMITSSQGWRAVRVTDGFRIMTYQVKGSSNRLAQGAIWPQSPSTVFVQRLSISKNCVHCL